MATTEISAQNNNGAQNNSELTVPQYCETYQETSKASEKASLALDFIQYFLESGQMGDGKQITITAMPYKPGYGRTYKFEGPFEGGSFELSSTDLYGLKNDFAKSAIGKTGSKDLANMPSQLEWGWRMGEAVVDGEIVSCLVRK
jgi:hypothetical protein